MSRVARRSSRSSPPGVCLSELREWCAKPAQIQQPHERVTCELLPEGELSEHQMQMQCVIMRHGAHAVIHHLTLCVIRLEDWLASVAIRNCLYADLSVLLQPAIESETNVVLVKE